MNPILTIAIKAARQAGAIITRASQDLGSLRVYTKKSNDFVTEVDRVAEETIIHTIRTVYPTHAFWGEESGQSADESEFLWIIDPLDGTTNFLHGFLQYGVSIALQTRGTLTHAVIYDPNRNDLFVASKGGGAFLNDKRLRVSKRATLATALIGTGFPFRDFAHLTPYMAMFQAMLTQCSGIRRPGSAALDLAYVAAGWYDGFWECGLSPWDIAAGALLIREAGGIVGDLSGNEGWLDSGHIVAGNPKIFAQMLRVLAPHLTAELRGELPV